MKDTVSAILSSIVIEQTNIQCTRSPHLGRGYTHTVIMLCACSRGMAIGNTINIYYHTHMHAWATDK